MKTTTQTGRDHCKRCGFVYAVATAMLSVAIIIYAQSHIYIELLLAVTATSAAWFWGSVLGNSLCYRGNRINVLMVGLVVPFLTVITMAVVTIAIQLGSGMLAVSTKSIFNQFMVYVLTPYMIFGWCIIPFGIWISHKLTKALMQEQLSIDFNI